MTESAKVVNADLLAPSTAPGDPVSVRATLGPHTDFGVLHQAVLECAPGRSQPRHTEQDEEALFVIEGRGTLRVGRAEHELEAESGTHLDPGTTYELSNPGPGMLRIVSVRIPDPGAPADAADVPADARVVVRRLADQVGEAATSGREFRIVADPRSGLRSATQFVGYVPAARAPEHFHTYDEAIYVIEGEGVFHADGLEEPLSPGSCIQIPARTVHCLENTGEGSMRLVAVFRPAGSPAAAYYPDGTPAHAGIPPAEPS